MKAFGATLLATILPVVLASLRGGCSSEVDCSLNGACVDGRCHCDAAWSGSPQCDVLAFEPAPLNGGYHNASYASWGGNAIFEDGKYHLFVAQMVNHCGLDKWGSTSSIVRAEADTVLGPYEFRETVFPVFSHNPTVRRMPSGGFAMYMIGNGDFPGTEPNCSSAPPAFAVGDSEGAAAKFAGGIYVASAPSILGPWSKPRQVNFANSTDQLHCCGYTNPSPHFASDGTIYLAFQSQPEHLPKGHVGGALVGLAKGTDLAGPFTYLSAAPVTPDRFWCIGGRDEDPFLWRSKRGFHILTHGMCPAGYLQAHYKFSEDGVHWHTSPRQSYHYGVRFEDGSIKRFPRMERPQLLFNRTFTDGTVGEPVALVNGVCYDGPNYPAAFKRCTLQTAGMTYTLFRPLRQDAVETTV